jgi:hypothetical protein
LLFCRLHHLLPMLDCWMLMWSIMRYYRFYGIKLNWFWPSHQTPKQLSCRNWLQGVLGFFLYVPAAGPPNTKLITENYKIKKQNHNKPQIILSLSNKQFLLEVSVSKHTTLCADECWPLCADGPHWLFASESKNLKK